MFEVINGKANVYKTRNPHGIQYYQYLRDHFEELKRVRDENYQKNFGVWEIFYLIVTIAKIK